jgi:hypothetical protein
VNPLAKLSSSNPQFDRMERSLSRLAIEREGNTRLVKASYCNDRTDKDVENGALAVVAFTVFVWQNLPENPFNWLPAGPWLCLDPRLISSG